MRVAMKTVCLRGALSVGLLVGGWVGSIGCAKSGTSETAERDRLTENVGKYQAPPAAIADNKPTVGVPKFQVTAASGMQLSTAELEQLAADQMITLLHQSQRFDVIERAQLQQLLDEQNLEGIVRQDQLAKTGQVGGVEYLLIGKVTNFRVKQDETKHGLELGGIGGMLGGSGGRFGAGSSGYSKTGQRITTDCGVDIRLVDPSTGKTLVAHFGEFKRTDSAEAMGVSILGIGASSDAQVEISKDDAGKIMRLAFDDALRKMIPEIDQKLSARAGKKEVNQGRTRTVATPSDADEAAEDAAAGTAARSNAAPAQAAKPAASAGAAKKFCAECGESIATGAKFCAKCGAKAS